MLTFTAWLAFAAQTPAATPDPCTDETRCVATGAAQIFAYADRLFDAGDYSAAEQFLLAVTADKHRELRAEAWFRIAAVREKTGDLAGSAKALRAVLAEQPEAQRARLELARILSRMGDAKAAAAELGTAQAAGLPPEVEQTVRQFRTSLAPARRRGLSLELASGPDSNINRATASQYVDTIIAPFELDPDARRRSGLGISSSVQGWSSDRLGPLDLLSRATLRADVFPSATRFNDFQLSADSGPQWQGRWGRLRPSLLVERRWFGGKGYEFGVGGQIGWQAPLGAKTMLELAGSHIRQTIDRNRFQSGWRSSANLSLSRLIGNVVTVRGTARYGALAARAKAESLDQYGADALIAGRLGDVTLFAEAGYTRTKGRAALFLFGKARRDSRVDLGAGAVFNEMTLGGFAPLVRVSYSHSTANIAIYDYRRTRLDIGFSRSF